MSRTITASPSFPSPISTLARGKLLCRASAIWAFGTLHFLSDKKANPRHGLPACGLPYRGLHPPKMPSSAMGVVSL